MIIMKMYQYPTEGTLVELPQFQVPAEYRPLLRPTLEYQSSILGLDSSDLRPVLGVSSDEYGRRSNTPIAAEVFTDGAALYVVTLRQRTAHAPSHRAVTKQHASTITLSYIGAPSKAERVAPLRDSIASALGVSPSPYYYRASRFEELKAEGRESPSAPTSAEQIASNILRARPNRSLITAIKAGGGLLVRDLARQLPAEDRDRTEEITHDLRNAGLLDSETVVICGKTQTQTARVPTRDVLIDLSQRGLKCACGKAIADERIEEALTITDFGRTVLDKSRWLTILVVNELMELGVLAEHLLIEQQLGGDEVDCLANISGELVLFELKDKEFNLGSAYSLGAKIGIIRPAYAVIVTTEHVGGDAKEHFQRARVAQSSYATRYSLLAEEMSTEIQYVEGMDCLRSGIREIISNIYARDAAKLIDQVLPHAFLNSRAVINGIAARSDV